MTAKEIEEAQRLTREFEATLLLCPMCGGFPRTSHARTYVYCRRGSCGMNGSLFIVADWQRNPDRKR